MLFGSRLQPENATDTAIKKMEAIVEDMRGLPVQRLREEMKELQVSWFILFEVYLNVWFRRIARPV